MSAFTQRYYKGYQLNIEGRQKHYCVRVFDISAVLKFETNDFTNNYSEKYKTPSYEEANEAFTHAYAWVDRGFCNQTEPIKKEDSWEEAYSKVREDQREYYSPWIVSDEEQKKVLEEEEKASDEEKEAYRKQKEVWEERLKEAYKRGWEAYKEVGERS
jgi:hypothetical protein